MKLQIQSIGLSFEFERDDANNIIPILLYLLGVKYTSFDANILFFVTMCYYGLLILHNKNVDRAIANKICTWWNFKCPKCKNRKFLFIEKKYLTEPNWEDQNPFTTAETGIPSLMEVGERLIRNEHTLVEESKQNDK